MTSVQYLCWNPTSETTNTKYHKIRLIDDGRPNYNPQTCLYSSNECLNFMNHSHEFQTSSVENFTAFCDTEFVVSPSLASWTLITVVKPRCATMLKCSKVGQSYVSWARGTGQGWHRYTRVQVDGVISKRISLLAGQQKPILHVALHHLLSTCYIRILNYMKKFANLGLFGDSWRWEWLNSTLSLFQATYILQVHVRVSQKENAGTLQRVPWLCIPPCTYYIYGLLQRQHMGEWLLINCQGT